MPVDMTNFNRQMKAFEADIEELGTQTLRKIALDVDQDLVNNTPVDTGRAKGNWLVGVNSVKTAIVEKEDKSGSGAILEGASEIKKAEFGDVIHIINNLPYINKLNDGSSTQAPAGFVESAVERAVAPFRK